MTSPNEYTGGQWLCVHCGETIAQHRVYRDAHNIPPSAVEGKFSVWTEGLYCRDQPERVETYDEHGESHSDVLRTKTGKVITEADILKWADEAEQDSEPSPNDS